MIQQIICGVTTIIQQPLNFGDVLAMANCIVCFDGPCISESADEPTTCLVPKITDLSKDQHASTPRPLATAQVRLSSHIRCRNATHSSSQKRRTSLSCGYRTISQCRTIYSAAIAQFRNIAQPTKLLSLCSFHITIASLYGITVTLPKVHCTQLLHQTTRNPSSYRHVITRRIDRSIRKGHPHLDHRFRRTWPKLASRIRIWLPGCDRGCNRLANDIFIYLSFLFSLFYKIGL